MLLSREANFIGSSAVIIPFFGGVGIRIGIKGYQKNTLIPNPDSDPAPIKAVKILSFAGVGIGIRECPKTP